MSLLEAPELRVKLLDFYERATVNNCDPGNFGIVTPEEVNLYMTGIGFSTVRSFHDWTVDYGVVLRNIVKENDEWVDFDLIDAITAQAYTDITGSSAGCELGMFTEFNRRAYKLLANTFGVYVSGTGFRRINDNQLFLFGGAFNTFVRLQDLQEDCQGAN